MKQTIQTGNVKHVVRNDGRYGRRGTLSLNNWLFFFDGDDVDVQVERMGKALRAASPVDWNTDMEGACDKAAYLLRKDGSVWIAFYNGVQTWVARKLSYGNMLCEPKILTSGDFVARIPMDIPAPPKPDDAKEQPEMEQQTQKMHDRLRDAVDALVQVAEYDAAANIRDIAEKVKSGEIVYPSKATGTWDAQEEEDVSEKLEFQVGDEVGWSQECAKIIHILPKPDAWGRQLVGLTIGDEPKLCALNPNEVSLVTPPPKPKPTAAAREAGEKIMRLIQSHDAHPVPHAYVDIIDDKIRPLVEAAEHSVRMDADGGHEDRMAAAVNLERALDRVRDGEEASDDAE